MPKASYLLQQHDNEARAALESGYNKDPNKIFYFTQSCYPCASIPGVESRHSVVEPSNGTATSLGHHCNDARAAENGSARNSDLNKSAKAVLSLPIEPGIDSIGLPGQDCPAIGGQTDRDINLFHRERLQRTFALSRSRHFQKALGVATVNAGFTTQYSVEGDLEAKALRRDRGWNVRDPGSNQA
jgi:hypothetical protein